MGVCSELSFFAFVQFFLFLRASLLAHEEYDSLELWIAGSPSDAQSLVRRAFLLALGTTDLRFWCRLKLKWIAEMRPQRQRDMEVAKGFKGQLNHSDFGLTALQKLFLSDSGSGRFSKWELRAPTLGICWSLSRRGWWAPEVIRWLFRNFLQKEHMGPSGEIHFPPLHIAPQFCFLLAVCPWARE